MPSNAAAAGPDDILAYRAQLLYFTGEPGLESHDDSTVYLPDGLLVVRQGHIVQVGHYSDVVDTLSDAVTVVDWRGKLIVPGFIDTHIHYPQTDIIASPAPGLLSWLDTYTFPAERRFDNVDYAAQVADFFLDELLRAGTTTALVYCTVHPESVDAFFAQSHARNLRMVAGKVLMDRHCPDYLQDTAQSGARDSEALIQRWHGRGRQMFALTPRFAPTSTAEQLGLCGELAQQYDDVFIQTHVAENQQEVAWAMDLFPGRRSYLDIYEQFGLLRRRAVYGHCIWLDDTDRRRMQETGAVAAHCPTSNLFLGSGLFNAAAARASGMSYTLGTDVGGGTSFSMLQTMAAAHNVARMTGHHLGGHELFYLGTHAAARALDLDNRIGTLAPGAEADFIVLDPQATQLLARRTANADSLEEVLFALIMLGDDRAVAAVYSGGRLCHERDAAAARPVPASMGRAGGSPP